jgi:YgiT-type zinc finger domain-containing protein
VALERRFKEAFALCPVCGGELVEKRVAKLLRGGTDTATIEVDALVCQRCGERLYAEETVRLFERIRAKLGRGETQDMTLVGGSYEASGG